VVNKRMKRFPSRVKCSGAYDRGHVEENHRIDSLVRKDRPIGTSLEEE